MGVSIRIWEDRWLPKLSTHRIISPRLFLHLDTHVQKLINGATVEWCIEVIDTLFLPHEADVIKSTPISYRLPPNKLIMSKTRNGLFTVRSAYMLVVTWTT